MSDTADTVRHIADTELTGGGNTGSNTPVRSRKWFMTWNNYPEEWKQTLTQHCEWKGQLEEGEGGKRHVQASLSFKNARNLDQLKKLFPGAHLEVTKCAKAADEYCTKWATRVGPTDYFRDRHMIPYSWQVEVSDIVAGEPDDRRIHWYWSLEGSRGKSVFVRHLVLKYNALVVDGCGRDVLFACAERGDPKLVVFDLPRGATVDYKVLEAVKNGVFFSGKYESKAVAFDYPHIFVFANFPPEESKLSQDRWWVRNIDSQSIIALEAPLPVNPTRVLG